MNSFRFSASRFFRTRRAARHSPWGAFINKAQRRSLLKVCAASLAGLGVAAGGIAFLSRLLSPDTLLIVIGLAGLLALFTYDVISRRKWTAQVARDYGVLVGSHDRLVREVARQRHYTGLLKEVIGDILVKSEDRALDRAAREDALEKLAFVRRNDPVPATEPVFDKAILELQMTPPPETKDPGEADALIGHNGQFSNFFIEEKLMEALRLDKIHLFMQPVVRLPQRRPELYEIFARVRVAPGLYLPAERYLPIAEKNSLMLSIDNIVLLHSLDIIASRPAGIAGEDIPCMLNVSAATLEDRHFMGELITFLSRNREMARRLVFELPQRDLERLGGSTRTIIQGLAALGCRFSLDRVHQRVLDLDLMRSLPLRYLKLDADWLLRERESEGGFARLAGLKRQLDAAGIDLIVEKIESESQIRNLLDLQIDYGQGYLFRKPDMATAFMHKQGTA